MTTIRTPAQVSPEPAGTAEAAQLPQSCPEPPAAPTTGPRSRSCRLSLVSQVRRMAALLPSAWRPQPMPPGAALKPVVQACEDDADVGAAQEPGESPVEPMLEQADVPDTGIAPPLESGSSSGSTSGVWSDGGSGAGPWEEDDAGPTRPRAAVEVCPQVDAVNREIDRLPETTSGEQLVQRIRTHLVAHESAGSGMTLMLLGDRSDTVEDDSAAAMLQAMAALMTLSGRPGLKRLWFEPAHHAGRAVAARCARAWGFDVLGHGHTVDQALRGGLAVAVASWRHVAALHQALAHTHPTAGAVLVAPLAPGDIDGARRMSHLLSAPDILKIKPVDDSIRFPSGTP